MEYKEFYFDSSTDDIRIYYYKFIPEKEVKAVIQISHGMAEKALRYIPVIEMFVEKGFAVYINDHRGHGKSAHKNYGYMGEDDVFLKMVRDMRSLNRIIHQDYDSLPIILLGHSMGSFLCQRYIQIYPDTIDILLLSGSNGDNQVPISKAGKVLSKLMISILGSEKEATLIKKLQDKTFNKKSENKKMTSSWLTTDDNENKKFEESKDMGFDFSTSAYYYLFKGITENFNLNNLKNIPKKLPILIFSGGEDPVGDYGRGPIKLEIMYKGLGMDNIHLKLYEGKKHELLNEVNRDEVVADILVFLEKYI